MLCAKKRVNRTGQLSAASVGHYTGGGGNTICRSICDYQHFDFLRVSLLALGIVSVLCAPTSVLKMTVVIERQLKQKH